MQSKLFSPLSIRDLTLRNRVMVSPMAQYSAVKGVITDWHFAHLAKFAVGGAGLVCVEATKIERRGMGTIGDTGIWNDEQAAAYRRLTDFIRPHGAAIALQINHAGRKAGTVRPWEGFGPMDRSKPLGGEEHWEVIGPSPVPHKNGWPVPREMTRADIADVLDAWVAAAQRADKAGFDVLEIHAAHGYLIHQFLSELSNRRTDAYGGDLKARMRFALEVIEAVRAVWPHQKPLFMRVSAEDEAGWTIDDTVEVAKAARERGVDLIDCSSGGIQPKGITSFAAAMKPGYQVHHAHDVKERAGVMTATVGLITEALQAEEILRQGKADLIAIGREMLNNPNWALHAAAELGESERFGLLPPQYGFWLERRTQTAAQKLAPRQTSEAASA